MNLKIVCLIDLHAPINTFPDGYLFADGLPDAEGLAPYVYGAGAVAQPAAAGTIADACAAAHSPK